MKNKILIFISMVVVLFLFQSCEIFYDKDTTFDISKISVKPIVNIKGESIIEIREGSDYSDAGVDAEAGDNNVSVEIVSGEVDANTIGFYVVTYRAENQYGWSSYAYRSVLVHDGTPYENENIGGNYRIGFKFHSNIEKYEKNGYWIMSNVWDEDGVTFPIVFAEDNDGTLGVVPGVHETKGRYSGVGEFTGSKIIFVLKIIPFKGNEYFKTFSWSKS